MSSNGSVVLNPSAPKAEIIAARPLTTAEQTELEELRAWKAAQLAKGQAKLNLKVSEKGAVSVYGLGRFPVTLYKGQWERLITLMPELQAFIKANAALLSTKE